jgi:glutathione S-transferase
VPALRIDGRRIQGTIPIAHALEELKPEPPLFPADPVHRGVVEEAERWGDGDFQHAPRRAIRWAAARDRTTRRWIADRERLPLAGLVAEAHVPIARVLASRVEADDEGVRRMLAELPGMLDRVDSLIADGVICGAERNAADYELLTTVRTILTFEDLRPFVAGRPCEAPARELWPDPVEPVPPGLPREWLAAASTG